ncbi:MAG: Tim44 domain-containing protein [Gammaproteobacteria bacterium]
MKSAQTAFVIFGVTLALLSGIPDAYAKRFGGGRSFGSRPSYSTPYRRSTAPRQSYAQQQAAQQNQSLRESFSRRGGLMGMLGGLALGGLLGSLLFGGAFENINFFDVLIFGAIAFLLYKVFAARSGTSSAYSGLAGNAGGFRDPGSRHGPLDSAERRRAFDTDLLFKEKQPGPSGNEPNAQDADFETLNVPEGFDQSAFLEGAKKAYRQLQEAWDRGDLAAIRGLSSDAVFSEIKDQIAQRESSNQTDILKLDAELLDVREIDHQTEATVLFDAILREARDERALQVREIWHFVRPSRSSVPTWFLDGIQQLED